MGHFQLPIADCRLPIANFGNPRNDLISNRQSAIGNRQSITSLGRRSDIDVYLLISAKPAPAENEQCSDHENYEDHENCHDSGACSTTIVCHLFSSWLFEAAMVRTQAAVVSPPSNVRTSPVT
jgi:hypothetical protein